MNAKSITRTELKLVPEKMFSENLVTLNLSEKHYEFIYIFIYYFLNLEVRLTMHIIMKFIVSRGFRVRYMNRYSMTAN